MFEGGTATLKQLKPSLKKRRFLCLTGILKQGKWKAVGDT